MPVPMPTGPERPAAPLPTRAEVKHVAWAAALAALKQHAPASKRYDADGVIVKTCLCGWETDANRIADRTRHLADVAGPAVAGALHEMGMLAWREADTPKETSP